MSPWPQLLRPWRHPNCTFWMHLARRSASFRSSLRRLSKAICHGEIFQMASAKCDWIHCPVHPHDNYSVSKREKLLVMLIYWVGPRLFKVWRKEVSLSAVQNTLTVLFLSWNFTMSTLLKALILIQLSGIALGRSYGQTESISGSGFTRSFYYEAISDPTHGRV